MVKNYIKENFKKCVRFNTNNVPGNKDCGDLIGLPYPYTVPSVVGGFQEMYYWDTYFTNVGLIKIGDVKQAKNNVDNMIYLIEKFGYMLNGNRTVFIKNSQPPFLSLMIRDIYEIIKDKDWLSKAYVALEREYSFWMTRRNTEIGLNQYGCNFECDGLDEIDRHLEKRVGFEPPIPEAKRRIEHFVIGCESGWDITPRWGFSGWEYVQPELNSLLYILENNMIYFSNQLANGNSELWKERAEKRKLLMKKYMLDGRGLYMDYNFVTKEFSPILSAASYFPLFAKIANEEEALAAKNALEKLEADFGILTCEKNDVKGSYQWNYPNAWAPLQYITIHGLLNYGYKEEALRIAKKFVVLVDKIFRETENLWEKYNAVDGSLNTINEYDIPPMLGWTAGTYLDSLDIIENQQ